jgi:diketogulonate reductase-like aldo/keto reductase
MLDTAKAYANEGEVGQALISSGLSRDDIFISTKLRRVEEMGHSQSVAELEASLQRLELDAVDLYLVHAPPHGEEARQAVWRGMEECLERGLTRAIGVSNYGVQHLQHLQSFAKYGPAVNQIELNPFLQREELVQATRDAGAIPMAYSPLARGQKLDDPTLAQIAENIGCTPAQVMIKWCHDQGFITIPKSVDRHRIIENMKALELDLSSVSAALEALEEDYISGWDPTVEP